jgi:hypothetical protein
MRTTEDFVVKHYSTDQRPILKGNGFDGLEIGDTREEAEEFVRWVNLRALEADVYLAERDHARIQLEHAVRVLTGIYGLLYPAPIKLEDGRTMVFRPENPHEFMQALSDRIRALPDELARAEHSLPSSTNP